MFHINVRRSLVAAAVAAVACAASTTPTASTAVAAPLQQDCQTLQDELVNASPSDFPSPAAYKLFIQGIERQLRTCKP